VEPIPFLSFVSQHKQIRKDTERVLQEVFASGQYILSQRVRDFEQQFARYTEVPFCFGVGSGLDALVLALKACALTTEDEVIVPAHTYSATWLAVHRAGARIVPVDADNSTMNIDTSRIPLAVTTKTRVILPVHMYGHPCNMTDIDLLSRQFNTVVIEDNAQAHGGQWLEKKTGSFGLINATSFYPTKNLGALGDGGAITLFEEEKADFVRRNRNYGKKNADVFADLGLNSRLDEIQAAILSIKLARLDDWNIERRKIATTYLHLLEGVGDLQLPLSDKEAYHVYHLFVVRTTHRDGLKEYLHDRGVETMVHYPTPPHLQPCFEYLGFRKGSFPQAERIAETALSLPLWPGMSDGQVEYIARQVIRFFAGNHHL
jgi:dTDP-4-amino-4,6-dideoxygalactose transaminase